MPRRPRPVSRPVLLIALLLLVLAGSVGLVGGPPGPAAAQEPGGDDPTVTAAPIPPPRASIVVDLDSGEVISASNEREAVPPASTTKILTSLLARERLGLDADLEVPDIAALAPPRRLQLAPGEVWQVRDLLYASMHCSCNDAAWALGQAAGGGTMEGFEAEAAALADQLGLADGPVVRDPAGLDNDQSVAGGNLLSARDLAIISRAYLADPELRAVAEAPGHDWVGGDGEPHTVTNLNRFLGRYEGSFGLKTGSTNRAGLTFVAAAERQGRTLIAVVLGSENHYAAARELLDAGFLLAAGDEGTGDRLPPVPDDLAGTPPTTTTTTTTSAPSPDEPGRDEGDDGAAAPVVDGDVLRSHPPPGSLDDTAGDRARTAVWVAVGVAGGLLVVAVAALARARTRRDRIDRRPARPRRRRRAARSAAQPR